MGIRIDIIIITLLTLSILLPKMEAMVDALDITTTERISILVLFISIWIVAAAMGTVMATVMAMVHSTISAGRTFMADFYTVFMPRDSVNKLV